jgi:hypothetical protein
MSYVWEFLLFVIASLVGNWLWQAWIEKREAKNQPDRLRKNCIEKIRHCINELDLNAKYIGGSHCPCKTNALEDLVNSKESILLSEDLINSVKQLIAEACIGRTFHVALITTRIKRSSKILKELLRKQSEELSTSGD